MPVLVHIFDGTDLIETGWFNDVESGTEWAADRLIASVEFSEAVVEFHGEPVVFITPDSFEC